MPRYYPGDMKPGQYVPADFPFHKEIMTTYSFPGLWPFIERAAKALDIDLARYGQTRTLWHCTQVQNGLGQLARMQDRAGQIEALAHINAVRDSLAAAVAGIDDAILEVIDELDLPKPEWAKEPVGWELPGSDLRPIGPAKKTKHQDKEI